MLFLLTFFYLHVEIMIYELEQSTIQLMQVEHNFDMPYTYIQYCTYYLSSWKVNLVFEAIKIFLI